MQEDKNPRKPLIYYYLIVLGIILIINTFVLPMFVKGQITQVDYGTFLKQIEAGQIKSVEIQANQIGFTTKSSSGQDNLFVTGRVDDPDLVNRLYKAGVEFSQVINLSIL